MDITELLYERVKDALSGFSAPDIYALSFYVYANSAFEYRGFENVSTFEVGYAAESDCPGVGAYDEDRWYAGALLYHSVPIIDVDEPNPVADALFDWYKEQGIDEPGYEDPDGMYDEDMFYVGKGPAGHFELVQLAADIALRLRDEGFIEKQFGKSLPIIIHALEDVWYMEEATEKANPNGEAADYFQYLNEIGEMIDEDTAGLFETVGLPLPAGPTAENAEDIDASDLKSLAQDLGLGADLPILNTARDMIRELDKLHRDDPEAFKRRLAEMHMTEQEFYLSLELFL